MVLVASFWGHIDEMITCDVSTPYNTKGTQLPTLADFMSALVGLLRF